MNERPQWLSLLRLAESTALLAGHYLKHQKGSWQQIESASGHDVKIRADRKTEELIIEQLRNSSDIQIYSEESVDGWEVDGAEDELYWIVDPLDGSLNYHQGLPSCAVSIALCRGWNAILGVVYDFNQDHLFSGLVGSGAWLNRREIKPSSIADVSLAVIGTGFPVNTDFSSSSLSQFVRQIQQFRKVRLLGSAALSLCYVASGKLDVYREEDIMFWDVAAGCAIVQAAGGKVEMISGFQKDKPVSFIATNGCLCLGDFKEELTYDE